MSSNPFFKDRVYKTTGRLIARAVEMRPEIKGWDWRIKIVDDPEMVCAWAMAGGKMTLYFEPKGWKAILQTIIRQILSLIFRDA